MCIKQCGDGGISVFHGISTSSKVIRCACDDRDVTEVVGNPQTHQSNPVVLLFFVNKQAPAVGLQAYANDHPSIGTNHHQTSSHHNHWPRPIPMQAASACQTTMGLQET